MEKNCYDCQYKKRKSEIGPNKKAFDNEMNGNTVVLDVCDSCNLVTGIIPPRDMDRAIHASRNEVVHPFAWD